MSRSQGRNKRHYGLKIIVTFRYTIKDELGKSPCDIYKEKLRALQEN